MHYSKPFDPEHGKPDRGTAVHLVRDPTTETYYIDAAPGYAVPALRTALRQARAHGMEPLDPDDEQEQGEAWTLDDGTIRIWLAELPSPVS